VTNVGSVEATSVKAILPETDFISLISFGTQQQAEGDFTLGSEQSAILSILVQTPSNQELGDIKGNIIVSSKETLKSIPLTLVVSSNLIMNFTVRVEDEYTYFAAGEPLVSNAVVRLVNYQRNIRITETTEDSGTVTFIDIGEQEFRKAMVYPSGTLPPDTRSTNLEWPFLYTHSRRHCDYQYIT